MSYDLKNAVAVVYNASFCLRKRATTGTKKQQPHQDLDDTEEAERTEDAGEKKEKFLR